ncbi:EF-hand domain-containing protein D1 [Drosophila biarmipes]|uniref:EF-hand domain-containing protein D1 n=1 Tax=Drosophila biarmipes TaxID=125945 RepID=UPI0007E7FA90|nr:EF-hand domain-containing protein D1 [Drosophila biarmipes]
MSEAVDVRDQFEIPAARSNDSQTSLQTDPKIELERWLEAEVCDEIINALKIPEISEEKFEAAEAAAKSLGEPEEVTYKEDSEAPEELEESNEFAIRDISLVEEDEGELVSGSSFTSCCSYKYIRQSILKRQLRNASTLSLDSGVDLDSLTDPCHNRELYQAQDPASGKYIGEAGSSIRVVMEKIKLDITPEGSECDIELSLDEVYQRFSAWFNRTEIDTAFTRFLQVDEDRDGYISLGELKRFLEKLEVPQTHLAAKNVMHHVVGSQEGRLNFCQGLLVYGTLLNRLELRKWSLQDREKQRLARKEAVDVSQVGVSGAKLFFEAKIAMQTEPLALNSVQPVTKVAADHSPTCLKNSSKREQFKSAAAVFQKLESDQCSVSTQAPPQS